MKALPTHAECRRNVEAGIADALERFIFEYEPSVKSGAHFRADLMGVLLESTFREKDSMRRISAINYARCLRWHPKGINSWSLSDWAVALAGEVGEACDVIKKLNRVRDGLPGNQVSEATLHAQLPAELADVFLYLDLLAQAANIDLPDAIRDKFNAVSERNNFPDRL